MKKYIYNSDKLRCRLKTTGYKNQIELQIQKKVFLFWINTYKWMHVEEGHWGLCKGVSKLINSYQRGYISEVYNTGELDINKRVEEFFEEYFKTEEDKKNEAELLQNVV